MFKISDTNLEQPEYIEKFHLCLDLGEKLTKEICSFTDMTILASRKNVYYLPVGLTLLQKDLIEILLSLHARSFLQQYEPDSALQLSEIKKEHPLALPALSSKQLIYMLSTNIRAIANHPCLLVEHYMPRQLLLMEPGGRLIGPSDKFRKLAHLLDNFIRRDRSRFPKPLQIGIISHSVKELDLIEGYLLGKPAKLKRLSGTSLFDERHLYGDPETEGSSPPNSTGHTKDEYDYGKRSNGSKKDRKEVDDWFFFATTKHMSHAPGLFDPYDIDVLISFDPMIDENLPSVANMQKGNKSVPMVKLLVKDSPDHYMLCQGKLNDEDAYLKDSLIHFIKNRQDIDTNEDPYWMRQFVETLLDGSEPLNTLPEVQLSNGNIDKTLLDCLTTHAALSPLEHVSFELAPYNGDLDIKTYQAKLMDLIVKRLTACQKEFQIREKEVLQNRLRETMRQTQFDETKVEVGVMFKNLKDSESTVADSAKRLASVKGDYEKARDRLVILEERKRRLESLISSQSISEDLRTMTDNLTNLKTELIELTAKNTKQSALNDELRLRYQTKSTEAANQSLTLKQLQETHELLKKELSGPAITLRTTVASEQEKFLQRQLEQHSQQAKFLQNYIKMMQKQYSLNGTSASNSSSSSNSRTRRGRSTAPVYT